MKKPSTKEIHDFINGVSGLVVHFSGCPKGGGHDNGTEDGSDLYPADLNKIIDGHVNGGISCSLIIPGDYFSFTLSESKATGSIGVIVGFDDEGLVAVSPTDCGSITDENHIRITNPKDITIDDLESSLSKRETYNEWVIKQNKVLGIFVFDTFNIPVSKYTKIQNSDLFDYGYEYPELQDVKDTFKNLEIYTFSNGSIVKLDRNTGNFEVITSNTIYC